MRWGGSAERWREKKIEEEGLCSGVGRQSRVQLGEGRDSEGVGAARSRSKIGVDIVERLLPLRGSLRARVNFIPSIAYSLLLAYGKWGGGRGLWNRGEMGKWGEWCGIRGGADDQVILKLAKREYYFIFRSLVRITVCKS